MFVQRCDGMLAFAYEPSFVIAGSYLIMQKVTFRRTVVQSSKTKIFKICIPFFGLFSKSCQLAVDFLRASGLFNSESMLVESEETRLERKWKLRYKNLRYIVTRCIFFLSSWL